MEELEAQTALELPNREMPLVTLVLVDLIDIGDVTVTVRNVNVAAQVCAALGGVLVDNSPPSLVCDLDITN
jgi:hypothetical protein